jgi:hypothetical protein
MSVAAARPPPPPPPLPPPPPDATTPGGPAAGGVTQYHAECTSADVASCVPECNAEHHGYELLATIDGTDTKFSCNLAHGLYSWMGAASEGGYLGSDSASFFSAVVSGAAGSYIVTLAGDAGIGTDLVIQPGQDVRISGDPSLAVPPSWGRVCGQGTPSSLCMVHRDRLDSRNFGHRRRVALADPAHAAACSFGDGASRPVRRRKPAGP